MAKDGWRGRGEKVIVGDSWVWYKLYQIDVGSAKSAVSSLMLSFLTNVNEVILKR